MTPSASQGTSPSLLADKIKQAETAHDARGHEPQELSRE